MANLPGLPMFILGVDNQQFNNDPSSSRATVYVNYDYLYGNPGPYQYYDSHQHHNPHEYRDVEPPSLEDDVFPFPPLPPPDPVVASNTVIESAERPFFCTFEGCNKSYAARQSLLSHSKTHTNRYTCPVCKLGCPNSSILKLHVKEVHDKIKHLCPFAGCGKTYSRIHTLGIHTVRKHKRQLVKIVGADGEKMLVLGHVVEPEMNENGTMKRSMYGKGVPRKSVIKKQAVGKDGKKDKNIE